MGEDDYAFHCRWQTPELQAGSEAEFFETYPQQTAYPNEHIPPETSRPPLELASQQHQPLISPQAFGLTQKPAEFFQPSITPPPSLSTSDGYHRSPPPLQSPPHQRNLRGQTLHQDPQLSGQPSQPLYTPPPSQYISGDELRSNVEGNPPVDPMEDVSRHNFPGSLTEPSNSSWGDYDYSQAHDYPEQSSMLQPHALGGLEFKPSSPSQFPSDVPYEAYRPKAAGGDFFLEDWSSASMGKNQDPGYQSSDSRNARIAEKIQNQSNPSIDNTGGVDPRLMNKDLNQEYLQFSADVDRTHAGGSDARNETTVSQNESPLRPNEQESLGGIPNQLYPGVSSQPNWHPEPPSTSRFIPRVDHFGDNVRNGPAIFTFPSPDAVSTDTPPSTPSTTTPRRRRSAQPAQPARSARSARSARAPSSSESISKCTDCEDDPDCERKPVYRGEHAKDSLRKHKSRKHSVRQNERYESTLLDKHRLACKSLLAGDAWNLTRHVKKCHKTESEMLPPENPALRRRNEEVHALLDSWFNVVHESS